MEHILPYAARHEMFPPGGLVLCALSGGGDSVALLHYLHSHGLRVAAAHFNHHLRPNAADDAAFARRFCAALGVPFYLGEGKVGELPGNVEENARNARYAFLEKTAAEIGAAVIATAHNANDNLETVLLHLTRGCGLNGLCGIHPKRGKLVRPMLQTTRAAVEDYLTQNHLEYVTDPTNLDDGYSRNRIRHQVVPVLESLNPRVAEGVGRMTEYLRADEHALLALAAGRGAGELPALEHRRAAAEEEEHRLVPQTLLPGRILVVTTGLWAVELTWTETVPEYAPNPAEYYLSGGKSDVFEVKARQTGEFLHPPNRTGKTLKKWMNELKIPEKHRDVTPVLHQNGKLVAAAAVGPDRAALARAGESGYHLIWYKLS